MIDDKYTAIVVCVAMICMLLGYIAKLLIIGVE
jgi:hypothetical protein